MTPKSGRNPLEFDATPRAPNQMQTETKKNDISAALDNLSLPSRIKTSQLTEAKMPNQDKLLNSMLFPNNNDLVAEGKLTPIMSDSFTLNDDSQFPASKVNRNPKYFEDIPQGVVEMDYKYLYQTQRSSS